MVQNHSKIDGKAIARCVMSFHDRRPHVHCITNSVAQHFTANVLLAAGGIPSMTIAKEEIKDFVTMADALLINLGTMDADRSAAVETAVDTVQQLNKPWVLDPVFVQASPLRLAMAKSLLARTPSAVRCNAAEGKALFGEELNDASVFSLAKRYNLTIALTGKTDLVADDSEYVSLKNGSHLMDRITTMGCALTALLAGFCVVEEDKVLAASSAITLFGLAGEFAEKNSSGPGSFVAPFLDALANLDANEIEAGASIR